jgi:hypothetical protein
MTRTFRPPYRRERLIAGAALALGIAAMQAACAPQTEPTSNAAFAQVAQVQAARAERVRAVQNVSDAVEQRLDRMVLNASLTAQR